MLLRWIEEADSRNKKRRRWVSGAVRSDQIPAICRRIAQSSSRLGPLSPFGSPLGAGGLDLRFAMKRSNSSWSLARRSSRAYSSNSASASSSFLRSSARRSSSLSRQSSKATLPVRARAVAPAMRLVGAPAAAGEDAVGGAVDVALEAVRPVAPDDVGKHGEAERPEHHEADHHQRDGCRRPGRTDQCSRVHFTPVPSVGGSQIDCSNRNGGDEKGRSKTAPGKTGQAVQIVIVF